MEVVDAGLGGTVLSGTVLGSTEVRRIDADDEAGLAVVVRVTTDRGAALEGRRVASATTNVTVTTISTRATTTTAATR